MAEEFKKLIRASMSRGVAAVELRVWAPQGAQTLFVKQVAPTLEDLTSRRTVVNPLTSGFPTGAWADETRDYHVAVRLPAKSVGQEQLASRVQLVVGADVQAAFAKNLEGDNDCQTFAECKQFLGAGETIHYRGASGAGPFNSANDPSSAFIGIYQMTEKP